MNFDSLLQEMEAQEASMPEEEDVGVLDRMSRGVDLLQATGGSAIQAAGEIVGSEGIADYGKEIVEEQRAEADAIAAPAEGLLDILFESVPAIAPLAAGAGTGAAIGSAILPVVGTGIGALAGLGIAAFGLNLGTVKEIEEMLDPESTADAGSLLTASLATVPDILSGGALSSTAKQAIKGATKKQMLKNVAKDTGIGVAAGAANMAILDVGATLSTADDFDADRLDAILENTATAALLNGLFNAGGSLLGSTVGKSYKNQEVWEQNSHLVKLDEEGNVVGLRQPNPVAIENPSVLSESGSVLLGRSFDPVIATHGDNLGVRAIVGDMDQTFQERKTNVESITVGTEAQIKKAKYSKTADVFEFSRMNLKDRKAVREQVVKGEDTPQANKIRAAMDEVYRGARKSGIKMQSLGGTYWPFNPDIKAIKKNKQGFIDDILTDYTSRMGKEPTPEYKTKVGAYADELLADGGIRLGDSFNADKLKEDTTLALQGDSEAIARLRRPIRTSSKQTKGNKKNNLEMHRKLSDTTPEVLNKWAKDSDPLDDLDLYFQGSGERLAFAEKFGVDGEKLVERLRLAQVEQLDKKGVPIPPDVIERLVDAANLTQRITSKVVGRKTRELTRASTAASNLITLPSALLSSLTEPLLIAPKTSGSSALTGLGKAVQTAAVKSTRKVTKGMNKTELDEFAEDMNTSLREAQSAVAGRLGEDTFDMSRAEMSMFKYNGLSAWTEFTRLWSQFAVEGEIRKIGKGLSEGKYSPRKARKQAEKLAEFGLDPTNVQAWVESGASKEAAYYKNIQAAVIDVSEDTILRPTPVRRPMWSNDPTPLFRFISNLKTYPITYTNRIMMPVAKSLVDNGMVGNIEKGVKTATYVTLATMGYMAQDAVKAAGKGDVSRWEDKEPRQKVLGALAQLGGLSIPIDASTSESFGGSAVESLAGPIISKSAVVTSQALGVLSGQIDPDTALNELIRQATPNVPIVGTAIRDSL